MITPPPNDDADPPDDGLTLRDLCAAAGIDARTFRYWVHARLLPPIDKTGPGVRYPLSYLHAVRWVQELQRQGHSLQEIARMLPTPNHGAEWPGQAALPDPSVKVGSTDAQRRKLLQDLLGDRPAHVHVRGAPSSPAQAPAPPAPMTEVSSTPKSRHRSAWDRYLLRPGIELQVQRPLDRDSRRRLDSLLDHAARLFGTPVSDNP